LEDLHEASEILIKALLIREKYMAASMQWFCPTAARFLRSVGGSSPYSLASADHVAGLNCDPKMVQGKLLHICDCIASVLSLSMFFL